MLTLLSFSLYLFGGAAFFALALIIGARHLKQSRLALATKLPGLAAFALILSLHFWYSMASLSLTHTMDGIAYPLRIGQQLLFAGSLLCLARFAWQMMSLTQWRHLAAVKDTARLLLLLAFFSWVYLATKPMSETPWELLITLLRWFLGLGGSVIAGLALIDYANHIRTEGYIGTRPLSAMGYTLIGVGITLQLGEHVAGLIAQTLCALSLVIACWYALRLFDQENSQQIEYHIQQSQQHAKLKELGELTSAVAHEIKTPLSSALMSCDLLEPFVPLDAAPQRQLTRIRHGLERAALISNEILSYAHQRPIERHVVHLGDVVRSALLLNHYRLQSIRVNCHLDEKLTVQGDAKQLEQVLSNLIANAIDACSSHERPTVLIESLRDKLSAIVRVSDNGSGMTPQQLDKAKQPFFTTKPRGSGTGMGLPISHQIALQHGGELHLKNRMNNDVICGLQAELWLPRNIK
ncbi:HAMP domain-containing histidine kinase [Vibrio sp. SM6]|uniref:histidine kinase n=1 Tax=Vibrio agarilyticus TaxID=2726741 RepID=A0A7X8TS88_9VIBR|nr:HAMP domain-containing sensor histidine kinase [Vibrio agarilyticus]NLS13666.1 HAMP domain-containing histidine kinase [Vibrio agarilyticus]